MKLLRILLIGLVVIVGVVGIVFVLSTYLEGNNQDLIPSGSLPLERQVGFTSEIVCLPHIVTTGSQTLECTLGILGLDDNYYGLRDDTGQFTELLTVGTQRTITGTLMPAQTDTIYNVKGIIILQSVE